MNKPDYPDNKPILLPAKISDLVLSILNSSPEKLTRRALEKKLCARLNIPVHTAKTWIRIMIDTGEIVYSSDFGHSFLKQSLIRPVQISSRVFLTSLTHISQNKEKIFIRINPGGAFGDGTHPTTRICIRMMDDILLDSPGLTGKGTTILDLGCGTGILLVCGLLLGVETGLGMDIEQIARHEARNMAKLHRLENRIEITETPLEKIQKKYTLVAANLRYPTLIKYADKLCSKVAPHGALVISGIKANEADEVLKTYEKKMDCVVSAEELGWTGMGMHRKL